MSRKDKSLTSAEDVSEQSSEEIDEEGKKKTRLEKIIARLAKFTGDEKKAKIIVGFFIFFAFVLFLLILSSLLKKQPSKRSQQPEPTPIPIPTAVISPTPKPTITPDDVDQLIEDIKEFDINQNDLLPPEVDLKITL